MFREMKTDYSRLFYTKYFHLENRTIEVKLKNGGCITGIIVGFVLGDEICNGPYITQWHIVDEKDKMTLGINSFGMLLGERIRTENIVEVKFFQDQTIMKFVK